MAIIIRGLEKEEIMKLNRLAASSNISREEYLRRLVKTHLLANRLKEVEDKYGNLVRIVADVVQDNTEQLEEMNKLINKLVSGEGLKND